MRDIVRSKTERELVRVKIHDGNAFWNKIGVNAGVSKLMLLSLNLLLPVLVYAARHSLTAVRHKLMLPGITFYWWFAEAHNLVALLEKPKESDGFEGIIDFLNVSSIRYALTVNPTIYTTCIEQFWSTAKVKTVNEECQIQALVDKKKVIITETSIRSDLKTGNDESRRKQRKDNGPTKPILDEATNEEHVSTPSNDPPQSGEDRLQLTELMSLCTSLQEKVLDLEKAKTAQAKEIASLKKRVKQLEKRKKRMHPNRGIADLDADAEVTLIDETQERNDEEMLFDVQDDLQGKEVVAEKEVVEKEVSVTDLVTTAGEVVITGNVEVTTSRALTNNIDEEKARLFVDLLEKRKKHFAALRLNKKSSKRAGDELEQEKDKKQKGDDDQEEEEMKKHMEIVQDDEVAIDAIPLATKPPMIMLQGIDREDLETLWKLVKAKHGLRRPEEDYERVLWGDLKVMFEPDVESELQLLSDYYCWKDYADRDEIKDLSEKR
ncbi:hypothetical protein Tco_0583532 [Tanacetum coccineum]